MIDQVAEEMVRKTQRMDAMESNMHQFAGTLENFLGRIQINDRLRLVPDTTQLTQGPLSIRSLSPAAPMDISMDENDMDLDLGLLLAQDTGTTTSEVNLELRHTQMPVGMSESAPLASSPTAIAPVIPPPAFNVIPATLQGSQETTAVVPAPSCSPSQGP